MPGNVNMRCTDSGGVSEEIKIGAGVLDYITELGKIQEKVQEAYTYAEVCVQILQEEEIKKAYLSWSEKGVCYLNSNIQEECKCLKIIT